MGGCGAVRRNAAFQLARSERLKVGEVKRGKRDIPFPRCEDRGGGVAPHAKGTAAIAHKGRGQLFARFAQRHQRCGLRLGRPSLEGRALRPTVSQLARAAAAQLSVA